MDISNRTSIFKLVKTNAISHFFQLVKLGFKNIDCLDPAEGMLETARKKNVYSRFVCNFISDEKLDEIEAGELLLKTVVVRCFI